MNNRGFTKFVMYGAREASESGFTHIHEQIEALEDALNKANPGLVFDLARTLLESVCKAILSERGIPYEEKWELPKLFKTSLDALQLVPNYVIREEQANESIRKLNGSLQTVVQSIVELRNTYGFASHGKGPDFQGLDKVHAFLVARAVDAIVHFLFTVHRFPFSEPEKPLEYEDNSVFNEYVDEENGEYVRINVLGDILEYRPSEVLFYLDLRAYESYLQAFIESNKEQQS
ncbi:abortive infection family protein [Thermosulfurimonas dismutans]|uniref:abortive infection family protein n=1 Tax=Thermosulfurimonas dismutans TaxID=999894 RepID=UPI000837F0FA|nr:abortive infection family protein [Thermosulfurimonas dismutans]